MRTDKLIGRKVADRFTIKRLLGEGGMATVYVAEQDREPREVALKIMNQELTADRSFVKRFQREANAAARVQHPNSVSLIDYGVADGLSYIAMELLEGDDLYVLLERDGAITQARAVRIVIEVCDALMVAHELGIVHRDLKPENIMVLPDPSAPSGERVKVLDFGIAKLLAPDMVAAPDPKADPTSGVTRAGTFIGTPAYMSPEQCALQAVDTRADLYTCGVLLFQLVTGRLPFEGQTPLHTATLHIHEAVPRPSAYAPTIDPRLEAVILKALAKKPADRHQTARHLATTLRKLLVDLPDVRVSTVAKPKPGSLRPSGRTRNSIAPAAGARPTQAQAAEGGMESAKTMVAEQDEVSRPAPVVLRENGPSSDPSADSTPARIRPAAGVSAKSPAESVARADSSSPSTPKMAGRDEPGADSDDSLRTLVRAPLEDEPSTRFGPQRTEVIMPTAAQAALAAALGPPPAPPPPDRVAPAPPRPLAPQLGKPATLRPPGATPPRAVKPTLKSAQDFKLGAPGAKLGGGPQLAGAPPRPAAGDAPRAAREAGSSGEPSESPKPAEDITVAPVIAIGGGGVLGSLQLGATQLKSHPRADSAPDDGVPTPALSPVEPGRERPKDTLLGPPPAPAPAPSPDDALGFDATTKIEGPNAAALLASASRPAISETASTVPFISPSLVEQAVAMGPRPAAGAPAVMSPPASSNVLPPEAAPPSTEAPRLAPQPSREAAVGVGGTAPMLAPVIPIAPQALPPTPPVYPLAPREPAAPSISGARGLLIGFLAGAVLMGIVALVYAFVLRR